ncbi:helix-turn-helix domain-containing protein [Candidatus Electronema sp. JM]|uniref:helix-turn-helix domain-containing protein n=1 Tax=Candidatus Electronema sp. JM TaxID=3401571 RepID=UPI003AA7D4F7
MQNENVCVLSDADFKRAIGVQRDLFSVMLEEIKKNIRYFGRPPKLSRADQLLMTLMYWRECRTEFHIGVSYGISESAVSRKIKKIEDALIESEIFHLPSGKRISCRSDLKTVLIDASGQPVERPKKRAGSVTAERKDASVKKFK